MSERGEREVRLNVPANLLLLGEYAVLEPGGLGLAVAPDVLTTAVFTPAPQEYGGVVRGILGTGTVVWPGDRGILGRVADSLARLYGRFDGEIVVDTQALFDPLGRKRGLGSSAAMTVALTAAWATAAGTTPAEAEVLLHRAVEIHRFAQGGKGSGYDVATSVLGGHVLFTGGSTPQARRVELPWLPPMRLFPGVSEVATRSAVSAYGAWKRESPGAARRFLSRSNELVREFVEAGSWDEAFSVFNAHRALGIELGDSIGISARIDPPEAAQRSDAPAPDTAPASRITWKAVGAGSELGVLLPADCRDPQTMAVSAEGIRWE